MSKRAEDQGEEPTATPKNRRTRANWQALVDAWQQSNQTQTTFCQEQGLCYQQFSKWKRRLKSEASPDPEITETAFIPVHWQSPQPSLSQGLPIILPNGIRIVIHDQAHLSWLPGIAQSLIGVSC